MNVGSQVAVVPSVVTSAPLISWVLHVLSPHKNEDRLNFHLFNHQCPPRQLFSESTAVLIEMPIGSDSKVHTRFTGNSKDLFRQLSFPDS